MSKAKARVPEIVQRALDECGAAWKLEKGGRHWKVFVAGRMCGILPMGNASGKNRRSLMNIRSQIRRAAKEAKEC